VREVERLERDSLASRWDEAQADLGALAAAAPGWLLPWSAA
jgi:hypothetical protein